MTQTSERIATRAPQRAERFERERAETRRRSWSSTTTLRVLGALSLLAMGSVHLEELFGSHYRVVPTIGPLFALNFAGAAVLALLLVLPTGRSRILGLPLAAGGIAMAVSSIVFLLLSEHQMLFGFMEYGYRPAIVAALSAEAAAVVFLLAYLGTLLRRS
jgi:hypothetical protein